MEIEGFQNVLEILTLAKKLQEMGRHDIVENHMNGPLCWDYYYEYMIDIISSVFSGFYCNSDDDYEEWMIFTDDLISEYYTLAHELGRLFNIPHDENPMVKEAIEEVRSTMNFSYSMDWRLIGYTKTKRNARESKLVVYIYMCDFCEYDHLAYALIELQQWFKVKCREANLKLSEFKPLPGQLKLTDYEYAERQAIAA